MIKRGKFIVVEGTDCSGKDTQTRRLIERVNDLGIVCHHLSFPRYETPTGMIVGECYLGKSLKYGGGSWFEDPANLDPKTASLFYAADRRAALLWINEVLDKGENIISDRYVTSNMGHQGGKIRDADERRKFMKWLHQLEYDLLELPQPDAVIFLYMPYQVGMELKKGRAGDADAHEANAEHLQNAEQAYLELAEAYDWMQVDCASDRTRDSLRTVNNIHDEVFTKAMKVLRTDR